jgi:hypothetical protein
LYDCFDSSSVLLYFLPLFSGKTLFNFMPNICVRVHCFVQWSHFLAVLRVNVGNTDNLSSLLFLIKFIKTFAVQFSRFLNQSMESANRTIQSSLLHVNQSVYTAHNKEYNWHFTLTKWLN